MKALRYALMILKKQYREFDDQPAKINPYVIDNDVNANIYKNPNLYRL
jgi:hypothetical protein